MEYDFDINAFNESKKSMTSDQLQSVGYSLTVMGLQIQDKARNLLEPFIRTDTESAIALFAANLRGLEEQIHEVAEVYGVWGFTKE
jgi:hypothetical protein